MTNVTVDNVPVSVQQSVDFGANGTINVPADEVWSVNALMIGRDDDSVITLNGVDVLNGVDEKQADLVLDGGDTITHGSATRVILTGFVVS